MVFHRRFVFCVCVCVSLRVRYVCLWRLIGIGDCGWEGVDQLGRWGWLIEGRVKGQGTERLSPRRDTASLLQCLRTGVSPPSQPLLQMSEWLLECWRRGRKSQANRSGHHALTCVCRISLDLIADSEEGMFFSSERMLECWQRKQDEE